MKFDDIFKEIGEFGPYQRRNYVLLIVGWMLTGTTTMLSVFVLGLPDHRCQIPGLTNDTFEIQGSQHADLISKYIPLDKDGEYDKCSFYDINQSTMEFDNNSRPINASTIKCSSWVYSKDIFYDTFVTKENLVCDDRYKISLAKTIYFAGLLTGSFLFGMISDVFGRKKTLLIGILGELVTNIALVFANNFVTYVIIRFCSGAACVGLFMTMLLTKKLVVSMVAFGLSLNVGILYGDYYVNYLLVVLLEIPGNILPLFTVDRIGRKKSHFIYLAASGFAFLSTTFTVYFGGKGLQSLTTALALGGKMFNSSAFATMYILSAEIFPTVMRNAGMGSSSCWARLGGMISPFIADTANSVGGTFGTAVPLTIFGGACLIAAGLTLILPETLNKMLPETIEDGINYTTKEYEERSKQYMDGLKKESTHF